MTEPMFAVRGPVASLDERERGLLLARSPRPDGAVAEATRAILADVRENGDGALRRLALQHDGVALVELEVPPDRRRRALGSIEPALRSALERAAENIRVVHESFRPVAITLLTPGGVRIGRRPDPLRRAGIYAPGGRAAYASSLLMGAVPARVAGVDEVVVCSPPGPDGLPAPVVLAAAEIARVDRVFAVGGAGAIAAMTWGTATIPRVDRISGPGNAWVAEAKTQVAGVIGVDAPAGPSELLIVADDEADPQLLARELAAQAEHDPEAAVALVALDAYLPGRVETALETILGTAPRAAIIRRALAGRGALLTAASRDEALRFAEAYAPEHLLLVCRNATTLAALARGAGTIFVGAASSVVFGDYFTGANHVLPTGGAARAWSGLSTEHFVRWTTWQEVPAQAAREMAEPVGILARAEGLPAHAAAADAWKTPT